MAGTHLMKRIPRIKFPPRHPKPADSLSQSSGGKTHEYSFKTEVPAPTTNAAVGGKASLQPKRKPLSEAEIQAIIFYGLGITGTASTIEVELLYVDPAPTQWGWIHG